MLRLPPLLALAALVALALGVEAHAAAPTADQKKLATAIGNGHSYMKHVVDGKEFEKLKIDSKKKFIDLVADVIANPTHQKKLLNNRRAYYDNKRNIIVIWNPAAKDKGTCFRPDAKKKYYDNLK